MKERLKTGKELEEEWAQALVKLLVEAIKVKNQEQVVE
jgi:hypothetical protein